MAFKDYQILFEAIKSDDEKVFTSLIVSKSDLNLCFGRFPLLSVCYLYKSYKIINKYEKYMLPINQFQILPEIIEIYKKFKMVAGRFIRFYVHDELVYPIEMLAMLDEREMLTKNYNYLFKNEKIIQNIEKIYNCKSKNKIKINSKKVEILPKITFLNISIKAVMVFVLCVCMVFPIFSVLYISNTTGLGTADSPISITSEADLISALQKGNGCYVLETDLIIDCSRITENFSGVIYGENHTIQFTNVSSSLINNFSGKIYNINFSYNSDEIIISESFAFLTQISSGLIENCTFSINSEVVFEGSNSAYFSLFVVQNSGTISLCSASANLTAENNSGTDSYISVFAGENLDAGIINGCILTDGEILTDTVDCAGAVIFNYGTITSVKNNIKISQTSSSESWSPNVSGIVFSNYGTVSSSINYADISATSTASETSGLGLFVAGVVGQNFNQIIDCENFGNLSASSDIAYVFIGGISAVCSYDLEGGTLSSITNSSSNCNISVYSNNLTYAGGISGYLGDYSSVSSVFSNYYSVTFNNVNFVGSISLSSDESFTENSIYFFSGGLIGYSSYDSYLVLNNSYSSVTYSVAEDISSNTAYAGLIGAFISSRFSFGSLKYVKSDSFNYSAYIVYYTIFGNSISQISNSSETLYNITSYESLEELLNALEEGDDV